MFQRQTRQSFPARNIIVLAAAVLLMFLYLAQRLRENAAAPVSTPAEQPQANPDTSAVQRPTGALLPTFCRS
jgi:hypothetical protein